MRRLALTVSLVLVVAAAACATFGGADGPEGADAGGNAEGGAHVEAGTEADAARAPGRPTILQAVAGSAFTCVILAKDGSIRCWGENGGGQLGLGDTRSRGSLPGDMGSALPKVALPAPAREMCASADHACAVLAGGSLYCWGRNEYGAVGVATGFEGDGGAARTSPEKVELPDASASAVHVACGWQHTCATNESGEIYCWGRNHSGQLGRKRPEVGTNRLAASPTPEPIALDLGAEGTSPLHASSIAAGNPFTCAVRKDAPHEIFCWGGNLEGELGLDRGAQPEEGGISSLGGDGSDTLLASAVREATAISALAHHVCAAGSAKCWGANGAGQLGYGDTNNRGDEPGEMKKLSREPIEGIVSFAAGEAHTCALIQGGGVKCWGANAVGQLGYEDTKSRGSAPNEVGAQLPNVNLGGKALGVAAGGSHSCAWFEGGGLKCWGENGNGQLGLGDERDRGSRPNEMDDDLPFVDLPEP